MHMHHHNYPLTHPLSLSGDPLMGPSAVDAVAAGCVYINPVLEPPVRGRFRSQHPFLEAVGPPHVCTVALADVEGVLACVRTAVATDLPPFVPPELTEGQYLARLAGILGVNK